jgi:hypothetical protein
VSDLIYPTVDNLTKLFSRFTYKPNWAFEVGKDIRGSWILARQWVEDSRAPFHPWPFLNDRWHQTPVSPMRPLIPVRTRINLDTPFYGEEHFWNWVRYDFIPKLEDHEMSEWFKVDGELMFDPHEKR